MSDQATPPPSGQFSGRSTRWVAILAATLVVVFALVFARFTLFAGKGTAEGPSGPGQLANASPISTATAANGTSSVGSSGTVVQGNTPNVTPIVPGYPAPNVISAQEQSILNGVQAYYGQPESKVILVSLQGQYWQAIQNGKIVRWTYVTTGRGALPTPTGWYSIFEKDSPLNFYPESTNPADTEHFGFISKVQYGMEFLAGGFYLHDVWWRTVWGPGLSDTHWDPGREEWSPGSHGCVNTPLDAMVFLYQWAPLGTPVIVF
jgi:hypothetical protein